MVRARGVASGQIWGRSHMVISACEHSTDKSKNGCADSWGRGISGSMPLGWIALKLCCGLAYSRLLKISCTVRDTHNQKNIFDSHENASETRKGEAKLASCRLRTEGRTNQVSFEHDM